MSGEGEDGRIAFFESKEVAGLVVGLAVVPAAPDDAKPFERESTQDDLMENRMPPRWRNQSRCPRPRSHEPEATCGDEESIVFAP